MSKLSDKARSLLALRRPFGFRVNYRVNTTTDQPPPVNSIYNFFQGLGPILEFNHLRDGLYRRPGLFGHVIFRYEADALKVLRRNFHEIDESTVIKPNNKPNFEPKRRMKYGGPIFLGFRENAKLTDLTPNLVAFPTPPQRKC